MFVATLIANPANPVLTPELAHSAMRALGATELYWLADGVACDIPLKIAENAHAALDALLARQRG